jgi:hypothetical protein
VEQLISLAGVILAISVTLLKDTRDQRPGARLIGLAWVLYLVSMLAGIWTLMALTGELVPVKVAPEVVKEVPRIGARIRVPSAVQILTFALATIALMIDGLKRLAHTPEAKGNEVSADG